MKAETNPTSIAAHHMAGEGWYTSRMLAFELNIDNSKAQQLIQRIERSSYYQTETNREVFPVQIKVVAINGIVKGDKVSKLWRLAIFGEQLA